MANAAGRLSGTLVSGAIFSYTDPAFATRGMGFCYLAGSACSVIATLLTYLIKDDVAGLHCGSKVLCFNMHVTDANMVLCFNMHVTDANMHVPAPSMHVTEIAHVNMVAILACMFKTPTWHYDVGKTPTWHFKTPTWHFKTPTWRFKTPNMGFQNSNMVFQNSNMHVTDVNMHVTDGTCMLQMSTRMLQM
jgi:hypothetical protein